MRLPLRTESIYAGALLLFALLVTVQAQQPNAELEQLLSHVDANTDQYNASVPSFLCDEHVTSQEFHDGKIKHEINFEALFRVTRSSTQTGALEESREVRVVNGKPSSSSKLDMPISFTGGFSGALTTFSSADRRRCFDYREETSASAPTGTTTVVLAAREDAVKEPACASLHPGTTGRFVVDSASMQVTHIERAVPHPVGKDQKVVSAASVDFAPFNLNGKLFWLPSTISASTSETSRTNAFSFTAHYSNYHRFTASSTILPTATDDSAAPQPR